MTDDEQPTNGPYHWGNGPQPKKQGILSRIIKVLIKGRDKR
jgi:hypothetical protein